MRKCLSGKRAEGYIDTVVLVMAAMMVIVLALNVFSFLTLKQDMDYFAKEIIDTATIYGRTGPEVEERYQELCAELGQEIKWHSPFRRTFIAYNATAYFSYIGPANFFVAGGYEAFSQRFSARGGLELVKTSSDAMFDLREELYPSEEAGDPYPDNCPDTLVNIPPNR